MINQQLVDSTVPYVALDQDAVCASFRDEAEAEAYLKREASYSVVLYRHNGWDWVMCRPRRGNALYGGPGGPDQPRPGACNS